MSLDPAALAGFQCPAPAPDRTTVQLAHGGGGRLMRQLLDGLFLPAFHNAPLAQRHDSAVITLDGTRVAFSTDTYVVQPRFFPGGDIGSLAVVGTCNDIAMAGARPAYLAAGFILEEGLPMAELQRITASMEAAAAAQGVLLVTGDTKVVDRGKADGVFINTTGLGVVPAGVDIRPAAVQAGDAVLVSGDVGRHGIAVLSAREGLAFETSVVSDCAPLTAAVQALLEAGLTVHCLRDATRGGLATALNEIATDAALAIHLDEAAVPVSGGVAAACELLGLDPLYVACEGRMVLLLPAHQADQALTVLRGHPTTAGARRIGTVLPGPAGAVTMTTPLGGRRLLDLLSGEQLPRIC